MTLLKKAFLSLLTLLFSFTVHAENANNNEITVFIAKKIITMDPAWPEATAVAVRDGKILSVGSLDDLKPWLDRYPYTIDKTFENKIIMPGFIEPHGHPLIGGTAMTRKLLTYLPVPSPYGPDFPGVKDKPAAMAKLQEYVNEMKDKTQPMLAWGYDSIAMGSVLDASQLDTISKTQPIIVWDASEHTVYANNAAMKKYQVTPADAKIPGVILDKQGKLTGQFYGVPATVFILKKVLLTSMTPEQSYQNIKFLMDLSHLNGITTMSELTFGIISFTDEMALYQKYVNDPNNPMRLVAITDATSASAYKGNQAVAFVKDLESKSNDKLMFNGVKFFSDDAFLNLQMVVENPGYIDGHKGIYITPPEKFADVMFPWWDAGFHIHVHSNGNGGNASTINALYQLMQRKPRFDHRFTIEHFGISTPSMAKEIKELGAVVSGNPTYFYARSELNEPYLGKDRADTATAFNSLVSAGVTTSIHSDTPVATPEPLKEVWMVVNRFGLSGKVHGPAERVTVDQALRMITINAAYTLGEEKKIGSISPGKFADFTILEADPYTVPPTNIKDIKLWGTVVGGKPYSARYYQQ